MQQTVARRPGLAACQKQARAVAVSVAVPRARVEEGVVRSGIQRNLVVAVDHTEGEGSSQLPELVWQGCSCEEGRAAEDAGQPSSAALARNVAPAGPDRARQRHQALLVHPHQRQHAQLRQRPPSGRPSNVHRRRR